MRSVTALTLTAVFSPLWIQAADPSPERLDNWPQWRGPNADGIAPRGDPPVRWDESTNVKWKVALPGSGAATPIVWRNRLYVLAAIETDRRPESAGKPDEAGKTEEGGGRGGSGRRSDSAPATLHQFVILCLDADTGKTVWQKVAGEEVPHEGHHETHGFASASPVTDGTYLYASFGSRGIYCHDLEGNLKWKRDLGDMRTRNGFGEGASPALHGDALVVNWDHEGESFIACLDAKTGADRWRVDRDERSTWATPFIVTRDGVTQVVTHGSNRVRSYDLASGKLIWECGGQASNPIASPVRLDGLVYFMTGHRGYALYAIPLDARGDITETDTIAWHLKDNGTYVASPVVYDGLLYFTKGRGGILSCLDAKTGKVHYTNQRLPDFETIYASLVGAAGKVYITARDGTTIVVKHGPRYEALATNKLEDMIDASPVIVGNRLYLRGNKHLYCITES
jgi:outer membrane protein assembly factor BamB